MERFWAAVAKDAGPVPEGIKAILSYSGYINGALAELGEAEIAAIEEDVRGIPFEAADVTIKPCFARFQNHPEQFRFVSGERAFLKMLAAIIKKNGINHYLKPIQVKNANKPSISLSTTALNQQADIVKRRIVEYYEKKYDGSNEKNNHLNALDSLNVSVHSSDLGMHAKVQCVYCSPEKYIQCRAEKTGRWKVTNFTSHLSSVHHINVQGQSVGRPASAGKENVPPVHNRGSLDKRGKRTSEGEPPKNLKRSRIDQVLQKPNKLLENRPFRLSLKNTSTIANSSLEEDMLSDTREEFAPKQRDPMMGQGNPLPEENEQSLKKSLLEVDVTVEGNEHIPNFQEELRKFIHIDETIEFDEQEEDHLIEVVNEESEEDEFDSHSVRADETSEEEKVELDSYSDISSDAVEVENESTSLGADEAAVQETAEHDADDVENESTFPGADETSVQETAEHDSSAQEQVEPDLNALGAV